MSYVYFNALMYDWRYVCLYVYECALLEKWVDILCIFCVTFHALAFSYHLAMDGTSVVCITSPMHNPLHHDPR